MPRSVEEHNCDWLPDCPVWGSMLPPRDQKSLINVWFVVVDYSFSLRRIWKIEQSSQNTYFYNRLFKATFFIRYYTSLVKKAIKISIGVLHRKLAYGAT
jgi:hypothetical protein